jgi:vacuolar-type H+-ATPase subunit I/STV1
MKNYRQVEDVLSTFKDALKTYRTFLSTTHSPFCFANEGYIYTSEFMKNYRQVEDVLRLSVLVNVWSYCARHPTHLNTHD